MSTKTISKRVALATVVALGAGVLSLVSVSSASAIGTNISVATGSNPAIAAAGTLYVASLQSTTGTPAALAASSTGISSVPDVSAAKSFGLLSVSDIAGGLTAGTTQTATLLSNGGISVYDSAAANSYDAIVVTGGYISAVTGSNETLNGTQTVATAGAGAVSNWGAVVKPNAGVSSFTIALYTGQTSSALASANPTGGTLSGFISVSVATASTSGTVSLTKSGVYYDAPGSQADSTSDSTAAGVGTSSYNVVQSASIVPKDAYSVFVAAGSLVTASATNGAYVALSANGSGQATAPSSAGTSSTAYTTTNTSGTVDVGMTVGSAVSTAATTTVTVSVNGVVIGTKAFTFKGKVAKVTLSSASNGLNPTTGGTVAIAFADSAGNAVYPTSASASYPQTVVKDAATTGAGVSLGAVTYPTSASSGSAVFGCGSINSTGNLSVDYVNADGTVVVSNSVAVTCSGVPYTYSATLNKAMYVPGDIATLTVTFKDSSGTLAADTSTGITNNTTPNTPVVSGSQLTAVSAPTKTDATTNGVVTYKFIVGTTNGSYQAVVDFPQLDSAASGQSSQTVAYSVSDSSTSLNDVLKGIVSLIASINKQIAALAKLVTKK
jgi:hypothetical protein